MSVMKNHRITLSIDTSVNDDELFAYLIRALSTIQWSALPHPHMRVAIESDGCEIPVFDSRAQKEK